MTGSSRLHCGAAWYPFRQVEIDERMRFVVARVWWHRRERYGPRISVKYPENNSRILETISRQDVAGGHCEVVAAIAGDQFSHLAEFESPTADDVQAAIGPRTRSVPGLFAHVKDCAEQISGIGLLPREDYVGHWGWVMQILLSKAHIHSFVTSRRVSSLRLGNAII